MDNNTHWSEEDAGNDTIDDVVDEIEEVIDEVIIPTEVRCILLKMECNRGGSGGCCGSKGTRMKYAIITIYGSDKQGWAFSEATPRSGNILQLAKKNNGRLWRGSVYHMGLHENEKFMAALNAFDEGLMKGNCKVIA